jgi:hypothetical protein
VGVNAGMVCFPGQSNASSKPALSMDAAAGSDAGCEDRARDGPASGGKGSKVGPGPGPHTGKTGEAGVGEAGVDMPTGAEATGTVKPPKMGLRLPISLRVRSKPAASKRTPKPP